MLEQTSFSYFGLGLLPLANSSFLADIEGEHSTAESRNRNILDLPLVSKTHALVALTMYYTLIFGGARLMRNRKPFMLQEVVKYWNLGLSTGSLVLLACFAQKLLPTLWDRGVLFAVCDRRGGWTAQMEWLYYLNYLTKYLELVDTALVVLRKKPLKFLHTYHHGATVWLCCTQLHGRTPVSWVPITLNLAVHVVMYWYYHLQACGVKVTWKKVITWFQIAQFVVDLGFIYATSFFYFSGKYLPDRVRVPHCQGAI